MSLDDNNGRETLPMLSLQNLQMYFGRKKPGVLDDAFWLDIPRFRVWPGEMVGIAGRSGEGKSTLLHVLGLLLTPPHCADRPFRLDYNYTVDGVKKAFTHPGSKARQAALVRNEVFGYVFQHHFNLPCFDAVTNATLPHMLRPKFQKDPVRTRSADLLTSLNLTANHVIKYPSQLSGGQNQRAAVARGLIHEPSCILADEPTASLDVNLKDVVLGLLRKHSGPGKHADYAGSVVIVSHELGDLARFCDRILVVQDHTIHYPFLGDLDDPNPEGLDPAGRRRFEMSGVKSRSDEDRKEIIATLSGYLWGLNNGGKVAVALPLSSVAPDAGEAPDASVARGQHEAPPEVAGATPQPTEGVVAAPAEGQAPGPLAGERGEHDLPPAELITLAPPVTTPPPGGNTSPVKTPPKVSPPPLSKTGGPLGMRGQVWSYARSEVFGPQQAGMRIIVALLVCLGTGVFFFLSDLGWGSVEYLKKEYLDKPDESLNRVEVQVSSVHQPEGFSQDQIGFLTELVNKPSSQGALTWFQEGYTFRVFPKKDEASEDVDLALSADNVAAVPEGDTRLQRAADPRTAQTGLDYKTGWNGPFTAEQSDQAGIIVSRAFLRRYYWQTDQGTAGEAQDYPRKLKIFLSRAPSRWKWDPPGFGGVVEIPVQGVFDYPESVVRNEGNNNAENLAQAYLPSGFYRRLKAWDSRWALLYPTTEKHPLIQDYLLLRTITITTPGAERPNWARQNGPVYRHLKSLFLVDPTILSDGIQVGINPNGAEQQLRRVDFERIHVGWETVRDLIMAEDKGASPVLAPEVSPGLDGANTVRASSVCGELTGLEAFPPVYRRAFLRFSKMDPVPEVARKIRNSRWLEGKLMDGKASPAGIPLECLASDESITKFNYSRDLLGTGIRLLIIIFLCGLTFIIGITTYLLVIGKTSDIGILRVHGLSPLKIAWVYQVELMLLILPSCLLGVGMAFCVARFWADAQFREQIRQFQRTTEGASGGTLAASADPTAIGGNPLESSVFWSLQQDIWIGLQLPAAILIVAALILVLTTGLSVLLIRRKSIVEALRTGTT